MSFETLLSEARESDIASGYLVYSRHEAASVTGSRVLEESIVEIKILNGEELSS